MWRIVVRELLISNLDSFGFSVGKQFFKTAIPGAVAHFSENFLAKNVLKSLTIVEYDIPTGSSGELGILEEPSLAYLSASSYPSIPVWPGTHTSLSLLVAIRLRQDVLHSSISLEEVGGL